jgi:hypothetical protein
MLSIVLRFLSAIVTYVSAWYLGYSWSSGRRDWLSGLAMAGVILGFYVYTNLTIDEGKRRATHGRP